MIWISSRWMDNSRQAAHKIICLFILLKLYMSMRYALGIMVILRIMLSQVMQRHLQIWQLFLITIVLNIIAVYKNYLQVAVRLLIFTMMDQQVWLLIIKIASILQNIRLALIKSRVMMILVVMQEPMFMFIRNYIAVISLVIITH